MANWGPRRLVWPKHLVRAFAGVLLSISLCDSSRAGSRPSPAGAPDQPVDLAPFLERTLSIGNLGSTTCNARRYAINAEWTLLAAPQDNGSVRLYDLTTGEALPPLEGGFKVGTFTYTYATGKPPAHFGFSSDNRTLVWSWGKKIVVWDVASRQVVDKQEVPGSSWGLGLSLFGGDLHQTVAVAFRAPPSPGSGNPAESADGKLVAYVNQDDDVAIRDSAGAADPRVLPGRDKDERGTPRGAPS